MLRRLCLTMTMGAAASLALPLAVMVAAPAAEAEQAAPAGKVSQKVGVPLKAALDFANKGESAAALVKLKEADAVQGKTAFEQFQINETYGFVYLKQKNFASAAGAFEKGLESGQMSPSQTNERIKSLAQLYLQTQPKKSTEYASRWLKATGSSDPVMYALLGQGYYFSNNFKDAAVAMQTAVKNAEAGHQKVEENWLRILQSSYERNNDAAGMAAATTMLVRLYPNQDNWRILMSSLRRQVAADDRATLSVYRLMYELDLMNKADDFAEASIVAIQAGVPGDAQKFMERGYTTKVLESGGDKPRSQRILADAKKRSAEQQASLPKLEKEAATASDGATDVHLGEVFVSFGQTDRAIAAARRAIQKGSTDDAYLLLGRAYLQQRNGAEARKAFAQVKDKNLAEVAKLWSIRASQV